MRRLLRTATAAVGMGLAISLASCAAPGAAVPAAPVAPAAAVPVVPGAPPVAPAEPLGFFGKMCAALDACRRKLCLTPAGQMLNSMTMPLSAATGGIFPSFCPIVPSAADLAKPGVAGASDAIKKDALEAKLRREKVRFLGTVDCRYYPDAVGALTAALRTDGSECVRYEAALALTRGCCCNQKTIDALDATVSGTDKDGNPAERSVRVRCAAAIALEHCLACYVPPPADVEVDPKDGEIKPIAPAPAPVEKKPGDELAANKPAAGGTADKKKPAHPDTRPPSKQSVEAAWQTINEFNALLAAERPHAATPRADRYSVYQIIKNVVGSPDVTEFPVEAPTGFPPPMATDPGTPIQTPTTQPPPAGPGRATLGNPTTDRGPIAPAGPAARPPLADATPGPLPPLAPTSTPVPPASATGPRSGTFGEATAAPPVAMGPAPGAVPLAPAINQLLHGATPAERQSAVRQIGGHDWQKNPAVASTLLLGAKNDSSTMVRVECIRQIATGQMAHPQILSELEALAQDPDGAVRGEAAKALTQLKPTLNP